MTSDTATSTATKTRRVLLLAESPYMGGITSHLLSVFAARQCLQRYEFDIATLPGRNSTDTTLIDAMRAMGGDIPVFSMGFPVDIRVLPEIRRYVKKNDIALVHTHNYRSTIIAMLAMLDVPVVATHHGAVVQPSARLQIWQSLERAALLRLPAVIACSNFVRQALEARGISRETLHTVYNGYRPRNNVAAVTRVSLGIPEDALIAFYAGRLAPGKRVDTLVAALRHAARWTVLLAGDGPELEPLRKQAAPYGDRVQFLGSVAQPEPYYALADAVVLPSEMEAMPMTLIEAAAFGKPAVACPVGGVPEVIEDGVTGILVPARNSFALGDALLRLEDNALRQNFGRRAREVWEARFTPECMLEHLGAVYDRVLSA